MSFKCKICGTVFEKAEKLNIHRKVHGRKSKVFERNYMDFNNVG
jgi:hypothetical protein